MTLSKSDFSILVWATLRMYLLALTEAYQGLRLNWWVILFHFALLMVFALGAQLVALLFGPFGMVGGFLLGFLLALLLSSYLSTVSAGVAKEKFSLSDAWERAVELFVPVIGALFMFFILTTLAEMALRGPGQVWILAAVNLLLAVLFNPLAEVIYQRYSGFAEAFGESFEFVKENFIEWFFPVFCVALPALLLGPSEFLGIWLLLLANNPLLLMRAFVSAFASPMALISYAPFLLLCLFAVYFVFLFRGVLYRELAGSTRRKRIYRERSR